MKLTTVVTIGKSLAIKREKSEAGEATVARLKFSEMFIQREAVNTIAGQRPGWAETSLFDEQGAPHGDWRLSLLDRSFSVTGDIAVDSKTDALRLSDATLSDVEITLTSLGALMSGTLSWPVAGDEVSDIEPLLGRECAAHWVLTDGGQGDLLKDGG